jgi:hypothetical protein
MAFQELMGLTNRLLVNAQALAALTARLRLDELGVDVDPAVRAQLDRVVEALGVESLAELDPASAGDIREVERTWDAPVRLVAGKRA